MITCPHCGTQNSAGTIFCSKCKTNVHWRPNAGRDQAASKELGNWWKAAVGAPPAGTGLGFLLALLLPPGSSDWMGWTFLAYIGGGLFVGAIVCVGCAWKSHSNQEHGGIWACLVAIPCLAFVLWILWGFWSVATER